MRHLGCIVAGTLLLASLLGATYDNAFCATLNPGDPRRSQACTARGCINQTAFCNTNQYMSFNEVESTYETCRTIESPVCENCVTTTGSSVCLRRDYSMFMNCLGVDCSREQTTSDCNTDLSDC